MSTNADLKPSIAVLKTLKSRYYELPRLQKLDSAFGRVLDQFLSAYLAGLAH